MTSIPQDEEFTELVDGSFPRVDLVGKAANGVPRFLIAKGAQQGVVTPAEIMHLIHKASTDTGAPAMPDVDLDAGTALAAEPDLSDSPGSAEWEALDAATAMKWTAILSRAKNALGMMSDREAEEVFAGDSDDTGNVFDLQDAACAIDCAISILAPYAVGEQSESDMLSDIGKAAQGLSSSTALDVLEGLAPVVKAGRVLSTQNETRIREAVTALQTVLSSLPAAPAEAPAAVPAPVAKEGAMTETSSFPGEGKTEAPDVDSGGLPHGDDEENQGKEVTPTSNTKDVAVPKDVQTDSGVAKASGTPMMAVYTSSGKLLGAIDPSKLTELQDGDGSSSAADPDASADPDAAADADAPAPTAPPADLAPAPSGTVGTPAAAPAPAPTQDEAVKAAISKAVAEVLSAKDAEHASVVKALEDRIGALEAPAPSRVLANGALPPTHMLRGMDRGGSTVDVAKAQELRDQLDSAVGAPAREAIAKQMNADAVLAWQALRDAR